MAKSIRQRVLSLILVCISVFTMFSVSVSAVQAQAAEIATPYYNNVVTARSTATISDSGLLTIKNSYVGVDGVTTKAVITTYVEKKTLGLFWTRVDIGTTSDQWVDTIYDSIYEGVHTFQLSSKGTYRVTVTYVIYGTDGAPDEIIKEIEKEY